MSQEITGYISKFLYHLLDVQVYTCCAVFHAAFHIYHSLHKDRFLTQIANE